MTCIFRGAPRFGNGLAADGGYEVCNEPTAASRLKGLERIRRVYRHDIAQQAGPRWAFADFDAPVYGGRASFSRQPRATLL